MFPPGRARLCTSPAPFVLRFGLIRSRVGFPLSDGGHVLFDYAHRKRVEVGETQKAISQVPRYAAWIIAGSPKGITLIVGGVALVNVT